MQAGLGAGLNVASMCFWGFFHLINKSIENNNSDKKADHSYVVRWESKAVIAVCNIFALHLDVPHITTKPECPDNDDGEHVTNGGS